MLGLSIRCGNKGSAGRYAVSPSLKVQLLASRSLVLWHRHTGAGAVVHLRAPTEQGWRPEDPCGLDLSAHTHAADRKAKGERDTADQDSYLWR